MSTRLNVSEVILQYIQILNNSIGHLKLISVLCELYLN